MVCFFAQRRSYCFFGLPGADPLSLDWSAVVDTVSKNGSARKKRPKMIWVMYATAKQSAKVVRALENIVPDANMKVRLPITEITNGRMGFQRLEPFGIDAVTCADGGGVSSCIALFDQVAGGV